MTRAEQIKLQRRAAVMAARGMRRAEIARKLGRSESWVRFAIKRAEINPLPNIPLGVAIRILDRLPAESVATIARSTGVPASRIRALEAFRANLTKAKQAAGGAA